MTLITNDKENKNNLALCCHCAECYHSGSCYGECRDAVAQGKPHPTILHYPKRDKTQTL
jgi:hypothetical protein